MYLLASKDLDEPAHVRSLIDSSAFPSVFTLYVVLYSIGCALLHLYMFSDFKPNQYAGEN